MSTPVVSVLMAARDAEATLGAAVASLRRQSLASFEAVVIDDGSVDSTGELLDEAAAEDPRFRVVHLARAGLVASLNAGLALCRAPLVARMDADDVCHPRRLELQSRAFAEQPGLGVVSCRVRHFPWREVGEGFRLYELWLNGLLDHDQIARERFVESPVAHPSATVRTELLRAAGGYRELGWPEDYDLWLRLLGDGVRFAKLPAYLLFWRDTAARLCRVDHRYGLDALLRCKVHHLVAGPLAGRPPVVLWGAGRAGRRLASRLAVEGVHLEAWVDIDPAKIDRFLHGAPIVSPDELPSLLGPDTVVLVVVAARGARALIRPRLEALGLAEGEGFWFVA